MIESRSVLIQGGTFHHYASHKYDLKELFRTFCVDAFHNSANSYDHAKCYPGTRKAVMKDLGDWVENDNREHPIYHLYAPAGSGKTAIARTLAETFTGGVEGESSTKKALLATFFFLRTVEGRNKADHFVATIAYQIAVNIPATSPYICEALTGDPSLTSRDLVHQMKTLILEPLERACAAAPEEKANWPKLIILDGLDECTGKDAGKEEQGGKEDNTQGKEAQLNILKIVAELSKFQPLPLAIFVSCRPELHIRTAFQTNPLKDRSRRTCLSNEYNSEDDIRHFLVSEFKRIREEHNGINQIPLNWPESETIEKLVHKSSGHFVYASVVVKYVQTMDDNPINRLEVVCGLAERSNEQPFAQLDALYSHILGSINQNHRDIVVAVFSCILARAEVPTTPLNPILVLDQVKMRYGLASLIGILVDYFGYENRYVKFLHASFSDFLSDESRSHTHFIAQNQAHATVSIRLLNHLMHEDDDSSPFVHESLQHHLPLAAPTEALHDQLLRLVEPVQVGKIIKRYVKFNVSGDGWDGIVELPRILEKAPFNDAADLSAKFLQHVNTCISTEVQKYAEEPLNCFVALLLSGSNVNYFLACNPQQRYKYRNPTETESQDLLLWPALGIESRNIEADQNSLNFWNMWHQVAWLRDVDLRASMRQLIKDATQTFSNDMYSNLCRKILNIIQEDNSRQHVLILELLEHVMVPLLGYAEPCQELFESLTQFKNSWWWNDCIPTKRFYSDDITDPVEAYLSRCTATNITAN